ncbi:MAG: hypothetical protein U5R31_00300 [Acidimicrobiia bacterium]|nr:hypothetical protein [Acidimicrobiia bacterium]
MGADAAEGRCDPAEAVVDGVVEILPALEALVDGLDELLGGCLLLGRRDPRCTRGDGP